MILKNNMVFHAAMQCTRYVVNIIISTAQPTYGKQCHNCNKLNHFATTCKFKENAMDDIENTVMFKTLWKMKTKQKRKIPKYYTRKITRLQTK